MSDTVTLHIPALIHGRIEPSNALPSVGLPIHAADFEANPDDFGLAIYADHNSESNDTNFRASVIARASSKSMEPLIITGDVFVVCSDYLAETIMENDREFQFKEKIAQAFHSWMLGYAETHMISKAVVFEAISTYVDEINSRARNIQKANIKSELCEALGIDPIEMGIISL